MAQPNIPRRNAGFWRDTRSDRHYFECRNGRPDRGMSMWPAPIVLTDDIGWLERAKIIRDLRSLVQTTWQARNKSDADGDAWRDAADSYRTLLQRAFKSDFLQAVERLRARHDFDIDPILTFLEADPYFYRS